MLKNSELNIVEILFKKIPIISRLFSKLINYKWLWEYKSLLRCFLYNVHSYQLMVSTKSKVKFPNPPSCFAFEVFSVLFSKDYNIYHCSLKSSIGNFFTVSSLINLRNEILCHKI